MTVEEAQAFIQTEEGRAWFEPIDAGQLTSFVSPDQLSVMVEDAKQPLLTQQTTLMSEAKKAKQDRRELQQQLDDTNRYLHLLEDFNVGVDDDGKVSYSKVEEVLRNLRSGKADPAAGATPAEIAEANRLLNQSKRKLETRESELKNKDVEIESYLNEITTRDQYIDTLLIKNSMRAALSELKYPEQVIKNILPTLVATSGAQVHYNPDEEDINLKWSAITNDNQSIEEWVKHWATTDDGQFFMPGRKNGGGGAIGSKGSGTTKAYKDMSISERTALFHRDPGLYRQLKTAHENGNS